MGPRHTVVGCPNLAESRFKPVTWAGPAWHLPRGPTPIVPPLFGQLRFLCN